MASEGQVVFPWQFGRYTLLQRLASGGMAEVFRAKIESSHGFEKIIVIKRILPQLAADPAFVTMFIDEAKLTARLAHPKIVQILDFGEVEGQYFIALELIDGVDALALLRAAAQKRVRVPPSLVVFVMAEVLDALDYAHTARDMHGRPMRLVHRDISPSNIFISRNGDVKLGDFGIAHVSERESKTQVGILKGKYGYMSPEQVTGGVIDNRSDLFAIGIVLAESFMGRRLFTGGNDLDVLLMVRDGRLDRWNRYGHDLPAELDGIVRKALHKNPEARFQTAGALRDALFDYLMANKVRVGSADLRGFISDVSDTSAEALARVRRQSPGLSEPLPDSTRTGVGSAPPAAPAFAGALEPVPVPLPAGGAGQGAAARATGVSGQGSAAFTPAQFAAARAPARQREIAAPPSRSFTERTGDPAALSASASASVSASASAPVTSAVLPAADLPTTELSLVDLDQWEGIVQPSSGTGSGTGFTPVRPAPASPFRSSTASGRGPEGAPVGPRFPNSVAELGRFISAAPDRPPDLAGDLEVISAMRVFSEVTVAGETGLLRFERNPSAAAGRGGLRSAREAKEVFLVGGAPESVNSSLGSERFGAYLVSRGVLRPADLETALGMLPQFSGKLGDTLVGMGLMRPLEVFRHLSDQVRDRVIDLFRWPEGTFAFFRDIENRRESFPLGLDGFEILGAGVLTIPAPELERRFSARLDSPPRRSERSRMDPDAFRLGPTPREVLNLLDGRRSLGAWLATFTAPAERATFLRSLYLLVETDLAELG